MKIFSGTSNKSLAQKIATLLDTKLSPIEYHVFSDGEQRVRIEESVVGEETVIIQPTGIPVDKNYMELFFIIDALKRNGAKSVAAVVPYFGYQRQDHVFRTGEARSFAVVAKFIEVLGVDRVITLDLHSVKLPELFHVPFVHLSALPLFAKVIKENNLVDQDVILASPDMGGVRRVEILSEMLGGVVTVSIEKNRDLQTGEITADTIHGEVNKHAIILDDMISSGQTIAQAVKLVQKHGAQKIWVFATHAVFSGSVKENLENLPIEKIYVTDTLFVPEEKRFEKLEVLSVADMIADELRKA